MIRRSRLSRSCPRGKRISRIDVNNGAPGCNECLFVLTLPPVYSVQPLNGISVLDAIPLVKQVDSEVVEQTCELPVGQPARVELQIGQAERGEAQCVHDGFSPLRALDSKEPDVEHGSNSLSPIRRRQRFGERPWREYALGVPTMHGDGRGHFQESTQYSHENVHASAILQAQSQHLHHDGPMSASVDFGSRFRPIPCLLECPFQTLPFDR